MTSATRTPRTGRRPPRTKPVEGIVADLVAGARPQAMPSRADMVEAIRQLTDQQMSTGQIAHRMGVSRRTVCRIRAAHSMSSQVPGGYSLEPPVNAPTLPWRRS